MKLIPKQFREESYCYYSSKSLAELKSEMQCLFEKTNGWNFSANLVGQFIDETQFEIRPKWQWIHIRGSSSNEAAKITGELISDGLNQTQVHFYVTSNPIFAFFFFLAPVMAIVILTTMMQVNGGVLVLVAFLNVFIMPVLMLLFSHGSKRALKNRFIHTFGLQNV